MSEKRRGRPRDRLLDHWARFFPEVRTRMSIVNRRDMMSVAFGILRLHTPEGQTKFDYLFNNGHFRKSILTELGRLVRRYRVTEDQIIKLAQDICEEKCKAKVVREVRFLIASIGPESS